ncbi:hypothetical protein [Clostridium sp. OS1-26]|uniref:hypothetical protein n=1 Tax=Clostridium sp. OS1-26 TaxID=3070681 RepID=UPI0027E15EE4|nr:hypothetical protein [Clostridium sp. OS1-26]WML32729.1 hypothetical protein RCG18_15275 [Clostridium sp. OS1-26]
MKKYISILLSIICITGLVGCGSKKNEALTVTPSSQPAAQSQDTTKNSSENIITNDFSEVSSIQINYNNSNNTYGIEKDREFIKKVYDTILNTKVTVHNDSQESNPQFTITLFYKSGDKNVIQSTETGEFIYRILDNKKSWVGGSNTKLLETIKVTKSQGSGNVQDKKASTTKTNTITDTSKSKNVVSNSNNGTNSFEKYFRLIGMSKEKLISTLNEQPVSVDESGLEFKKNGIRVWFDYNNGIIVNQIYIEKSDVNYNGVKIGDTINNFKKVFGKPEREDTSSAYCNFKYNGMFLNVSYDPKTQKTISVYIMKNDFK